MQNITVGIEIPEGVDPETIHDKLKDCRAELIVYPGKNFTPAEGTRVFNALVSNNCKIGDFIPLMKTYGIKVTSPIPE